MIDKVHQWYMGYVPDSKDQLAKFLSRAYMLGHKNTRKYASGKGVYAIPNKTTAFIPTWVLSNGMFPQNMSEKDKNAHITAFWNTAVLMNSGMVDIDLTNVGGAGIKRFSDEMTYAKWSYYLNRLGKLETSKFNIFSQTTMDYIYSLESLAHAYEMWSIQPNTQTLVPIVEHYQNKKLRKTIREIVGDQIADVLDIIADPNSEDDLIKQMANELYKLLAEEPPQPPEQESSSSEEEDSDSSGNEQPGDSEQDESDGDQDQNDGQGSDGTPEELQDIKPKEMPLDNRRATRELGEALDEINDALVESWGNTYQFDKTILTSDALEYKEVYNNDYRKQTIKESDHFANLGTLLRQIKILKNEPITPNWYGNKLLGNNLHRIKSDQKVFGTAQQRRKKIKKEWVICVDLSGSMSYFHLWTKTLAAAKGAYLALRDAQEMVSIYGHTTKNSNNHSKTYWNRNQCSVISIAKNGDALIDQRFNYAASISREENYDYYVLDWLVDHAFKDRDSMKIIIMLSDGKPVPHDVGIEWMATAVTQARRKGVFVLSGSLTHSVVENNDEIYGEDWNINLSYGNIDEKLRELFIRITEEYHE